MTDEQKRQLFKWHRLRQWRVRLAAALFTLWLVLLFTVSYEHNTWLSVAIYAVWAAAMVLGLTAKRSE